MLGARGAFIEGVATASAGLGGSMDLCDPLKRSVRSSSASFWTTSKSPVRITSSWWRERLDEGSTVVLPLHGPRHPDELRPETWFGRDSALLSVHRSLDASPGTGDAADLSPRGGGRAIHVNDVGGNRL